MTRCADAVWVGVSIGSEILVYKAPNGRRKIGRSSDRLQVKYAAFRGRAAGGDEIGCEKITYHIRSNEAGIGSHVQCFAAPSMKAEILDFSLARSSSRRYIMWPAS